MERKERKASGTNGCRRLAPRAVSGECRRQRVRKHDQAASRKIVAEYGHLVRFIAHKLSYNLPPSIEITDLINVGLIGLLDAAERFDASRGFKFSTFAEFRVRGAMLDEIRRQDWLPRGARERAKEYVMVRKDLLESMGRLPTNAEVSTVMGLPEEKIADLERNGAAPSLVRLEESESGFDLNSECDVELDFSPLEIAERNDLRKVLETVLKHLPKREGEILTLYYFQDLNLKEIGQKLAITESRVSQLHTRAIQMVQSVLDQKQEFSELKKLLA